MGINEKSILEETLEIEQDRLVGLEERKFLLVSFCKNTSDIDKEIKQCKESIKDLQNKIKGLK